MNKKLILGGGLAVVAAVAGGIAVAQPRGPWAKIDANSDGAVTRAEVIAHSGERFARLDADGDGRLTAEERGERMGARADKRFARFDTDGNGQISRAEFDAHGARRMAQGGKRGGRHSARGMRGAVDTNGDGAVTREEFAQRALAMFERGDADKDGTVTAAERDAAMAAVRERRGQ